MNRRDFLKITSQGLLGLSGMLGIAGIVRFLSFEPDPPPPQRFDMGPGSLHPEGSRTVLQDVPALLIHTAEGFTALSLTCPHLGCTVAMTETGMECPCHGSRYNKDGQLLQGPATKGLPSLKIETSPDDHLIILKG
jgi:cytochrome b6-f complex iron-sulfur subunit